MTLPYIFAACRQNPESRFLFVTTPFPSRILSEKPANLEVAVFRKKEDKIISFVRKLHHLAPHAEVIDLHSVPRTKWFDFFLRLLGHKITVLDKPRKARSLLLSRPPEPEVPSALYVPPMTRLYSETLQKAGIPFDGVALTLGRRQTARRIGLALFAQHEGKMLLPTQEEKLVRMLSEAFETHQIILYGAPVTYELERRRELSSPYENVSVAEHASFADELKEISSLTCMISMDSANQHIARFLSVPVVSIWMQTHPAAGFLPLGMDEADCIGTDLPCRPCSIYGNKPCKRRDWACKHRLDLSEVIKSVQSHLT